MTAPVRIGLVGYGFGGRHFHAPLLASAQNCEFAGVVTTSPERAAQVHDELDGRRTYASLAELAADGAEAVAISTPASTHIPLVREALELGLATVSDKPFALDAASAQQAVALAEQRGVLLSVYQNRRWDSDFRTVRRLISDGELGAIRGFESRFERFAPDPGPPAAGGGTLLDFGSHLVDQALVLFGPVSGVYAEVHDGAGLDDDVFVALTHANGVRSHLWGSWRQGAPGPRFRVTGERGSYVVDGMDGQEALLLSGASPTTLGEAWGTEPEQRWGELRCGEQFARVPSERGRWDSFYPALADAVRGAGPVPVDPRDAITTARVLDAARASNETGQVVPVGAP